MNKPKKLMEMTNQELWQLFPIILKEHDSDWEKQYQIESARIIDWVGAESIARISHIGSTAVPNLIAKPTIDILLELKSDARPADWLGKFENAGYIVLKKTENPPPHLLLMQGYTQAGFAGQAYHVHVRYFGDWDELYFRDYLYAHPNAALSYGELKRNLQRQFEHDRDGYTNAKGELIRKLTLQARQEFGPKYGKMKNS
jgi:GrpB-like predicted nucleotidyltransferase (UPF0157 family)